MQEQRRQKRPCIHLSCTRIYKLTSNCRHSAQLRKDCKLHPGTKQVGKDLATLLWNDTIVDWNRKGSQSGSITRRITTTTFANKLQQKLKIKREQDEFDIDYQSDLDTLKMIDNLFNIYKHKVYALFLNHYCNWNMQNKVMKNPIFDSEI